MLAPQHPTACQILQRNIRLLSHCFEVTSHQLHLPITKVLASSLEARPPCPAFRRATTTQLRNTGTVSASDSSSSLLLATGIESRLSTALLAWQPTIKIRGTVMRQNSTWNHSPVVRSSGNRHDTSGHLESISLRRLSEDNYDIPSSKDYRKHERCLRIQPTKGHQVMLQL
ncbi:hypothetical protein GE09DRAFT_116437 [Coniochaeta sp. 2T2.1]|nr:hypothetical protein GE09DRAFT_116437 [Coniochaeta sp. 2T2.1]